MFRIVVLAFLLALAGCAAKPNPAEVHEQIHTLP